jgi:hypothetical protein
MFKALEDTPKLAQEVVLRMTESEWAQFVYGRPDDPEEHRINRASYLKEIQAEAA